jgi:hypothetical protein
VGWSNAKCPPNSYEFNAPPQPSASPCRLPLHIPRHLTTLSYCFARLTLSGAIIRPSTHPEWRNSFAQSSPLPSPTPPRNAALSRETIQANAATKPPSTLQQAADIIPDRTFYRAVTLPVTTRGRGLLLSHAPGTNSPHPDTTRPKGRISK